MLSVNNLSVSIASASILDGVALDVRPGTLTGLMGRNGAGKTTFMRSVMGLIPHQTGVIRFRGDDLAPKPQ
jgi:branched-chain amino acid transport system ATP-binding protein